MNNPAAAEIDKVMSKFFAVFDNRDGNIPDFGEFGQLFEDTAMIYKSDGQYTEPMCVEEFMAPRAAILTDGTLQDFYEWEISHKTVINGGIATRLCRYGKSGLLNGAPYAGEGDKHIQLVYTTYGWQIVSVIWQDEE
jgi:hypothetical protein